MRVLTPQQKTAVAKRQVAYVVLVEAEFPSGPVYFNDSPQTIFYGGKEYLGGGRLLELKLAREDASLGAHKATITLDGLDGAAISLAFNEPTENAPITFRMLLRDVDTRALLGDFLLARYTVSEVRVIPPTSIESQ